MSMKNANKLIIEHSNKKPEKEKRSNSQTLKDLNGNHSNISTYPPCFGLKLWDYGHCYGTYGNEPCQFSKSIDMEDIMNNEKRKEKSRDAARCRRSRESDIFNDLATNLPISKEDVNHLDKASIMRLSIAYLKVQNMLALSDFYTKDVKISPLINQVESEKMALKSLDGFLLILSGDGDITYVSENISDFLGLSQIDLLGQPIWEYSHQCDHEELRDALHGRHMSPSELLNGTKDKDFRPMIQRDFFLRLKCTLTSRGRSINIKSASYKVIHITGHIAYSDEKYRQLVAIGRPIPHPSNIEIPLGCCTFLTKHSLDMKFSYVDDKMLSLLGYRPEHLLSKSLFSLHHGADSSSLLGAFKTLINKGQSETHRYRYLARCGGYVWVVTQATVVYDKQKPQSVVCVNYAISDIEKNDEIFSCAQFEAYEEQKHKQPTKSATINKINTSSNIKKCIKRNIIVHCDENDEKCNKSKALIENIQREESVNFKNKPIRDIFSQSKQKIESKKTVASSINRPRSVTASIFAATNEKLKKISRFSSASVDKTSSTYKTLNRPQNATSKIFTPRTNDMNKGYLIFVDEKSELTMLKDEPDDLTHLAPTPGDACIPLDDSAPFFSDMFDDFMIPDTYSTLLPDDIHSLDSQESTEQKCIVPNQIDTNKSENTSSSINSSNSSLSDPFINYRDESSDTNSVPHLLSRAGLTKSPDTNSMPSLCSPDGSLPGDDLAFISLHMEDDMDLRAPYIPMNEAEDLPLLVSDDLMWGAHPDTLTKEFKNSMSNKQKTVQEPTLNTSAVSTKIESNLVPPICEQEKLLNHQKIQQRKNSVLVHSDFLLNEIKLRSSEQIVDPKDVIGNSYKNCNENIHLWSMNDLVNKNGDKEALTQTPNKRLSHVNLSITLPPKLDSDGKNFENSKLLSHKRPNLGVLQEPSNKRAKGSTSASISTKPIVGKPELLQQLIGGTNFPHTFQRHQHTNMTKINDQLENKNERNCLNVSKMNSSCLLKPVEPSSSSVLMNLLVSGCDKIPLEPPKQLMDVDVLNDDLQDKVGDLNHYDKQIIDIIPPEFSTDVSINGDASSSIGENDFEIWKEIQAALRDNKSLGFLHEIDDNLC
uniref:CSON002255 protein n=1 Tax=Culicoides sonorensis TaxID=179676 RepID=A0A336K5R8_CULSO